MFLEDITGFLPFPHLDDLPSLEPIVDNADFFNDLVDGFEEEEDGRWTMDSEISQERRDSTENKSEKRKRGPGRPANKKSLREKREAANSREKKRMRALVRW